MKGVSSRAVAHATISFKRSTNANLLLLLCSSCWSCFQKRDDFTSWSFQERKFFIKLLRMFGVNLLEMKFPDLSGFWVSTRTNTSARHILHCLFTIFKFRGRRDETTLACASIHGKQNRQKAFSGLFYSVQAVVQDRQ